tara:strand:+ start:133 stop:384 length:252 start_codon:yes stop_codon:yes gene_type:complete
MGQLDDFSLDQMAGASALIISSIGGLLLIVFKSKCRTISCCWGMWSCIREVNAEEDEESDEEKVVPDKKPDKKPDEEEQIIQD